MTESRSNLFFPHGGLMIWIFSFLELIVFSCASIAFLYQRGFQFDLFLSSRLELDQTLGTINTIVLIASSYSVVRSTKAYDKKEKRETLCYLSLSIALGVLFLCIKFFEYNAKIDSGLTLGSNTFFDYYWVLTGFHAIHLALGLLALCCLTFYVKNDKSFTEDDFNFHTAATYWHLCDLIWIIIFPLLYLL